MRVNSTQSLPTTHNHFVHTGADHASVQELGLGRALVPIDRAEWLTTLHITNRVPIPVSGFFLRFPCVESSGREKRTAPFHLYGIVDISDDIACEMFQPCHSASLSKRER